MEQRKFGRRTVVAGFSLSALAFCDDAAAQRTSATAALEGDPAKTLAAPGAASLKEPAETTRAYPPCLTEPDDASTEAAKGAFQAGNAAFQESDYDRAIVYWEDSYRRACTAHPMLKNLARAYELNGQPEQALVALRTYVKRAKGKEDVPAVQRRITTLEAQLAPPPPPPPPPPADPTPSETDFDPVAEPENDSSLAPMVEQDTDDGSGRSIAPLIVGGVGLVAVGVGTAFLSDASDDHSEAMKAVEACGMDAACQAPHGDAQNAARDRQIVWNVVIGVGGAAAIAGVIWYITQDDGSEQDTVLVPAFAAGYAGLQLSGSF